MGTVLFTLDTDINDFHWAAQCMWIQHT